MGQHQCHDQFKAAEGEEGFQTRIEYRKEVSVLLGMIGDSLLETCNLNRLIENISLKYLILTTPGLMVPLRTPVSN